MVINHFGILVYDMDRMLEFYQECFGFEITRVISTGEPTESASRFSGSKTKTTDRLPRVVMLRAENCYLEVMENLAKKPPETPRAGYTQMCVEVKDIENEYSRCKSLGIDFVQPSPIDLGYVKVLTGFDPEGNQIELLETAPDYVASTEKIIQNMSNYHSA